MSCAGEKDPRCLNIAFALWPTVPALFPESDPDGYAIFEVRIGIAIDWLRASFRRWLCAP